MNRLIGHGGGKYWAQRERDEGHLLVFFSWEESSITNSNRFYKSKHGSLFSPIMRNTMKITIRNSNSQRPMESKSITGRP